MAKVKLSPPSIPTHQSRSLADSNDTTFDMAQAESSAALKITPKKLIVALPNPLNTQAIARGARKSRIVSFKEARMTLIIRSNKTLLNLNARPPVNMEEEMRLSVLRHKKAEEEAAMKQAEAAEGGAERAVNNAVLDPNNSRTMVNGNQNLKARLSPTISPEAEMWFIREALITASKQMFLTHKYTATASTIRRKVREELQLPLGFFKKNGWPARSDLIIMNAFSDARSFEILGF